MARVPGDSPAERKNRLNTVCVPPISIAPGSRMLIQCKFFGPLILQTCRLGTAYAMSLAGDQAQEFWSIQHHPMVQTLPPSLPLLDEVAVVFTSMPPVRRRRFDRGHEQSV
jgi:hypothetical protein